jgi:hypothetical protein
MAVVGNGPATLIRLRIRTGSKNPWNWTSLYLQPADGGGLFKTEYLSLGLACREARERLLFCTKTLTIADVDYTFGQDDEEEDDEEDDWYDDLDDAAFEAMAVRHLPQRLCQIRYRPELDGVKLSNFGFDWFEPRVLELDEQNEAVETMMHFLGELVDANPRMLFLRHLVLPLQQTMFSGFCWCVPQGADDWEPETEPRRAGWHLGGGGWFYHLGRFFPFIETVGFVNTDCAPVRIEMSNWPLDGTDRTETCLTFDPDGSGLDAWPGTLLVPDPEPPRTFEVVWEGGASMERSGEEMMPPYERHALLRAFHTMDRSDVEALLAAWNEYCVCKRVRFQFLTIRAL